jgi:TPR repeat protein
MSALCNLGYFYHNMPDPAKKILGVQLYKQAADYGHALASFNVGCCFRDGSGIPENPQLAKFYFQRSAAKGERRAMFCLSRLYAHGNLGYYSRCGTYKWLLEACDLGHTVDNATDTHIYTGGWSCSFLCVCVFHPS